MTCNSVKSLKLLHVAFIVLFSIFYLVLYPLMPPGRVASVLTAANWGSQQNSKIVGLTESTLVKKMVSNLFFKGHAQSSYLTGSPPGAVRTAAPSSVLLHHPPIYQVGGGQCILPLYCVYCPYPLLIWHRTLKVCCWGILSLFFFQQFAKKWPHQDTPAAGSREDRRTYRRWRPGVDD